MLGRKGQYFEGFGNDQDERLSRSMSCHCRCAAVQSTTKTRQSESTGAERAAHSALFQLIIESIRVRENKYSWSRKAMVMTNTIQEKRERGVLEGMLATKPKPHK